MVALHAQERAVSRHVLYFPRKFYFDRHQINRVEELKTIYKLQAHEEGGYFSEVYTAPFEQSGRASAGSIYFLLDKKDISHFHQLDCDEVWYFHEGGGVKITALENGNKVEYFLGVGENQNPLVIIKAGTIFAAENINKDSYTLISCMTTPRFRYEGFRLVRKNELKKIYPSEEILYLAVEWEFFDTWQICRRAVYYAAVFNLTFCLILKGGTAAPKQRGDLGGRPAWDATGRCVRRRNDEAKNIQEVWHD